MRFKWVEGAHLTKYDADVIGAHLDTLTVKHGGSLTAIQVLEDAKSKRSPLHPLFEWNETKAAEEYRLAQARYVIRSIRVVVGKVDNEEHSVRVRKFLKSQGAYVSHARISSDADLYREAMQDVVNELLAIERKYAEYSAIVLSVSKARVAIQQAQQELTV